MFSGSVLRNQAISVAEGAEQLAQQRPQPSNGGLSDNGASHDLRGSLLPAAISKPTTPHPIHPTSLRTNNSPAQRRPHGRTSMAHPTHTQPLPLPFTPIPRCITSLRAGNFLIVLDAPSRENEGDLLILASALTPSKAAFLIHHTSGYLCAPLSSARALHLGLPPMVPPEANSDPNRTAYTVTVDATDEAARAVTEGERGMTTGISAMDRSTTVRVLADPRAEKAWLRRPGHVVPLVAREGGVRERRGHTEAAVEFARLCGKGVEERIGVIGELVQEVGDDGEEEEEQVNGTTRAKGRRRPEYAHATGMMRAEACLRFGRKWGIDVCTIEDLVKYVEEEEGKVS
ncbi:MAG: hypothetical protein M1828_002246 [Chrysothrix sp. TS-e1954]|nr:MAG: hypothetical protein M1828_002246 [Chrysothrix sp. TS-e1954]